MQIMVRETVCKFYLFEEHVRRFKHARQRHKEVGAGAMKETRRSRDHEGKETGEVGCVE